MPCRPWEATQGGPGRRRARRSRPVQSAPRVPGPYPAVNRWNQRGRVGREEFGFPTCLGAGDDTESPDATGVNARAGYLVGRGLLASVWLMPPTGGGLRRPPRLSRCPCACPEWVFFFLMRHRSGRWRWGEHPSLTVSMRARVRRVLAPWVITRRSGVSAGVSPSSSPRGSSAGSTGVAMGATPTCLVHARASSRETGGSSLAAARAPLAAQAMPWSCTSRLLAPPRRAWGRVSPRTTRVRGVCHAQGFPGLVKTIAYVWKLTNRGWWVTRSRQSGSQSPG